MDYVVNGLHGLSQILEENAKDFVVDQFHGAELIVDGGHIDPCRLANLADTGAGKTVLCKLLHRHSQNARRCVILYVMAGCHDEFLCKHAY